MTTQQEISTAAPDTQHPHHKRTRKPGTRHTSAAPTKKATSKEKAEPSPRPNGASKQDRLLTLLRRPSGATIAVCMKASGWQAHSVRGFFAGTVRKKLKLNLVSEVVDGQRIYRIAAPRRKSKG